MIRHIRQFLASRIEPLVAAQRERTRLAYNDWANLSGKEPAPMCPEGSPLPPQPWLEQGWTDRHGVRWVTCPCGMAHPTEPTPYLKSRGLRP